MSFSPNEQWQTINFPFSDQNVSDFKRINAMPNDCAINAFELVKLFSSKEAADWRDKYSKYGKTDGFSNHRIFNFLQTQKSRNYRFYQLNWSNFVRICKTDIKPNSAALCRYPGHMFVVAKNNSGNVIYMDPQTPMPEVLDRAYNTIGPRISYQILQTNAKVDDDGDVQMN